jgi:type III secretion protein V
VLCLHELPVGRGEFSARDDTGVAAELGVLLDRLVRRHASALLGIQQTQGLLDGLAQSAPALVQAVVPRPVSLKVLTDVLRGLLGEGVSIRGLAEILETLADEAPSSTDPGVLVERVRLRMSRQLTFSHAGDGPLILHPVDPMIEDALRDALPARGEALRAYAVLALPPDQAQDIVDAVRTTLAGDDGAHAVLVTQPDVRRHLRKLIEADLPDVAVLSYPELAADAAIDRRVPVRVGRATR